MSDISDELARAAHERALAEIWHLNEKLASQAERLEASDAANGQMLEEIKRLNAEIKNLRAALDFYKERDRPVSYCSPLERSNV